MYESLFFAKFSALVQGNETPKMGIDFDFGDSTGKRHFFRGRAEIADGLPPPPPPFFADQLVNGRSEKFPVRGSFLPPLSIAGNLSRMAGKGVGGGEGERAQDRRLAHLRFPSARLRNGISIKMDLESGSKYLDFLWPAAFPTAKASKIFQLPILNGIYQLKKMSQTNRFLPPRPFPLFNLSFTLFSTSLREKSPSGDGNCAEPLTG